MRYLIRATDHELACFPHHAHYHMIAAHCITPFTVGTQHWQSGCTCAGRSTYADHSYCDTIKAHNEGWWVVGCGYTDRDRHKHRGPPRFPARQHTQHTTCCMLRLCAFLSKRQCAPMCEAKDKHKNIPLRGVVCGGLNATCNLEPGSLASPNRAVALLLLCGHFGYGYAYTFKINADPNPSHGEWETKNNHSHRETKEKATRS